jgi:hypothetical protein
LVDSLEMKSPFLLLLLSIFKCCCSFLNIFFSFFFNQNTTTVDVFFFSPLMALCYQKPFFFVLKNKHLRIVFCLGFFFFFIFLFSEFLPHIRVLEKKKKIKWKKNWRNKSKKNMITGSFFFPPPLCVCVCVWASFADLLSNSTRPLLGSSSCYSLCVHVHTHFLKGER